MSFPERLSLSHLIDGENEKDAAVSKEHHRRHLATSLADAAAAAAAVDGDTGETCFVC